MFASPSAAFAVPAPEPNDVYDARNIGIGTGLAVLFVGWVALLPWRRRNEMRIMRHAAFWPYDRPAERQSANDTLGRRHSAEKRPSAD